MFYGINSYNTSSNAVFRYWLSPTIVLSLVYLPAAMLRRTKLAQKSAVQVGQVATVVMETTQLILSQFKLFIVVNGELNKVGMCQKLLVNVVKWWSYIILIVAVRFFWDTLYSNYGAILYRLKDIASCWSKIAKFLYPTCT